MTEPASPVAGSPGTSGFEAVAGASILQRWVDGPLWLMAPVLTILMTVSSSSRSLRSRSRRSWCSANRHGRRARGPYAAAFEVMGIPAAACARRRLGRRAALAAELNRRTVVRHPADDQGVPHGATETSTAAELRQDHDTRVVLVRHHGLARQRPHQRPVRPQPQSGRIVRGARWVGARSPPGSGARAGCTADAPSLPSSDLAESMRPVYDAILAGLPGS